MINRGTILYFGNFEMPDKDASAHRVLNNGRILSDYGYNVVFCGVEKKEKQPEMIYNRFVNNPRKYPTTTKEWLKDLCSFSFYKKCFDKYPDIKYVILYDFHALPFKRIRRYCKKNRITIVGDITEWYENHFSLFPSRFAKFLDTNLMMRHYYKKVDRMIVISSFLENYYKRHVKRICKIPPLIDINDPKWEESATSNIKNQCPVFIYTGSTNKTKDDLGLLFNAFSSLDPSYEYKLIVYGVTEKEFAVEFPKEIPFLNAIRKKVEFKGRVSHEESLKGLRSSDCSLIIRKSSRKNNAGFPTKFVESYTAGVDIIATDISDLKEYKTNNVYICSTNQLLDDLIATISKYISSYIGHVEKKVSDAFYYKKWESNLISAFINDDENITN